MVIVEANLKQGRATANDFSFLQSSYLLEYMMAVNQGLFEEDRDFQFQVNACHLKQVIAECMISMFKWYVIHLAPMHTL